jgi:hypothetical protein
MAVSEQKNVSILVFFISDNLQVLCEGVQSREVNKSQLPRILNKIKLHISIEEQYTLSTQVSQSQYTLSTQVL